MNRPVWIVLEGGDGAGKGVAAGIVKNIFDQRGIEFIRTREPGGTPEGEELRAMLLGESGSIWEKTSEIMLMTTSRVQHVARVIRPALRQGQSVLCDRYVHSTVAYQGHGHQGALAFIEQLHEDAVGGDMPDLTIILDLDPEIGIARAKRRLEEDGVDEGRMENLEMDFHRRVRQGYLSLAKKTPESHIVIDASQTIEDVQREIERKFTTWLNDQENWQSWHNPPFSGSTPKDIQPETTVFVRRRNGFVEGPLKAISIGWSHNDVGSDIIAYRVKRDD